MSTLAQPLRQEIPDPQIRDDQYESARKLLFAQPPGSGVLLPLINVAAIATELYLKCLSAEKVHTAAGGGWSKVSAKPIHGHELTELLDKVRDDVKHDLDSAFRAEPSSFRNLSFRDALKQCEGMFEESRYPFEPNGNLSKYPLDILMACSNFLQQFVAKLRTRETITP
jgi:hypothetical protein